MTDVSRPGGWLRGIRLSRDQRLFAVILVISIAAVIASFVAIRKAEHYLLETEASATAIHWAKFLEENLTDIHEILASGLVSARDQQVFRFASEAGRVYRYQVIRPDGVTALSSWAGDYRISNTDAFVSRVIATRKPVVALSEGVNFDQSIVIDGEAYVPILMDRGVIGIIRVYVDMTQRALHLRTVGNMALVALMGLLTVIGALSGAVVWHNIRDRNRELREIRESRERIAKAERTIRALQERLAVILRFSPAVIYSFKATGDFAATFVSESLENLFGYKPSEYLEDLNFWRERVHPEDRKIIKNTMSQLRDSGTHAFEYRFRHKDGSYRWVNDEQHLICDIDGTPIEVVGSWNDISERKRAEQTLAKQAADLARSNTELEQFAYVASHDLQEPLRKIQAFADRLKAHSGEALDETARDYLGRMLNATERMRVLINDLLTLSRVGTSEQAFEPVDLNALGQEVVSDLEVRIQGLGATVEIGDLPTIDADPTQMRQLIQNLVSNALKFQRPDVKPVVRVRAQSPAPGAGLSHGLAGEYCQILVEDNGIGFEEKHAERIFAVFRRLHGRGEYEGTGVGLAICRKIAERHNGDIRATSKPGEGATFIVTLPTKQEREQLAA